MNLEERRVGNGSDRIDSLSVREVKARSLTACDDDKRDLALAKILFSRGDRLERRDFGGRFVELGRRRLGENGIGGTVVVAEIAEFESGWVFGSIGERRGGRRVVAVDKKLIETSEINTLNLTTQRLALFLRQLVPKCQ